MLTILKNTYRTISELESQPSFQVPKLQRKKEYITRKERCSQVSMSRDKWTTAKSIEGKLKAVFRRKAKSVSMSAHVTLHK